MSSNSQIAFNPQGDTIAIAATTTAPDGVQASTHSRFSAQETGQVRVVNAGSVTVFLGFGATAEEAASNAVAAAAGTPAAGVPLLSGAVEILRFPAGSYFSGYASSAATVYITPGQGI